MQRTEKEEQQYRNVCRQLGFNPEVNFVKITTFGRIGFTAGKPDEILHLLRRVRETGMIPAASLLDAVRREDSSNYYLHWNEPYDGMESE